MGCVYLTKRVSRMSIRHRATIIDSDGMKKLVDGSPQTLSRTPKKGWPYFARTKLREKPLARFEESEARRSFQALNSAAYPSNSAIRCLSRIGQIKTGMRKGVSQE